MLIRSSPAIPRGNNDNIHNIKMLRVAIAVNAGS